MVGICAMCKEHGVELTKHHVVESLKDEKGNIRTLYLCQKCHDNHNLYVNALIANKIPFDRTKEINVNPENL